MNFFKSASGNYSNSRLVAFIIIMVALVDIQLVLFLGHTEIVSAATAAGVLFMTIAGPAMVFLFAQKKIESKDTK